MRCGVLKVPCIHFASVLVDSTQPFGWLDKVCFDVDKIFCMFLHHNTTRYYTIWMGNVRVCVCREDELKTTVEVAMATGVVLDPVYSGKAVHVMLQDMRADPEAWQGRRVLFIHTGGLLGTYDKIPQLQPLVESISRVSRMQVRSV